MSSVMTRGVDDVADDVWLGAHDLVQENLWTWAWSGSSFDVKFWAPGEPNDDDDGKENCMELNEDSWLWNDEDCSHKKHFICQMRCVWTTECAILRA